jgi:integrase
MKLTDIVVKNLIKPGRYTDDQTKGLHLWVKDLDKKYWILRYTHEGRRYGLSLGVYPEASLRLAREKALQARNELIKGVNPIVERVLSKKPKQADPVVLFSDFALDYIETMKPRWRNAKHGDQWVNTVITYANPVIGQLPVAEIDTQHILAILQPIWLTKPETASRLRGRLQQILTAAVVRKLRPAFNPAAWDGHLAALLPSKRTSDKHHAALPFEVVPSFVALLRDMDSLSALALEFCILNACRTSEVLQARWSEIKDDVWIIPGTRMKAGKEHVAPLSRRSMEILVIARQRDHDSDYVFSRNGKPLSNMAMLNLTKRLNPAITVHGFRSSFRDWISEATELSPELAEMQLAHTIGNRVERAYRRGNLLEKRRRMMESWAYHCDGTPMNRLLSVLKAA